MKGTLLKLIGLRPNDYREIVISYRFLLSAGWRIFVRKENIDRWAVNRPSPSATQALTQPRRDVLTRQAGWINAAARQPLPWARCLQRSVALCLWMESEGIRPELKIGVRKNKVALVAHAWVEYHGQVLNDSPDRLQEFAPLIGASILSPEKFREGDGY